MRYALIRDGMVQNIIELKRRNASNFQDAVPCGDTPVAIGDTYADGVFYRDGERVLTAAEEYAEALEFLLSGGVKE